MKKEIVGCVVEDNGNWIFKTEEENYIFYVPFAIDEILDVDSQNGDKFKITIEKLN